MSDNSAGQDHGTTPPDEPFTEKIRVQGEALLAKIKELLHEGNVQRIIVKDSSGYTVMEIPVNAGVVAAIVAPVLIAVAALAALASDWNIEVYRSTPQEKPTDGGSAESGTPAE
ncbi:hypothetical protein IWX81_002831 [Salinibacterium sp. CAN_S4]|uniref:DUF4342 domain-containing protein n=1 Tax=Salinibacterium sp. CAN_S4 TaxID=2787727 RepID=UPI0018F02D4C